MESSNCFLVIYTWAIILNLFFLNPADISMPDAIQKNFFFVAIKMQKSLTFFFSFIFFRMLAIEWEQFFVHVAKTAVLRKVDEKV